MPDTKPKATIILPKILQRDQIFADNRKLPQRGERRARTDGNRHFERHVSPRNMRITQPNRQRGN